MPVMMTVKQYAEHTGRSASTIRAMCQEGRMPGAIRPGNEWIIDPIKAAAAEYNPVGRPPVVRAEQEDV